MSLAIDTSRVISVLLADGWHDVVDRSFDLDAYEYLSFDDDDDAVEGMILHGGGQSGVCATGFTMREHAGARQSGTLLSGPLTAILAVRHELRPAQH